MVSASSCCYLAEGIAQADSGLRHEGKTREAKRPLSASLIFPRMQLCVFEMKNIKESE